MPALRRLDLRGGFIPDIRGLSDDPGSQWLTAATDMVQSGGRGVAKVDAT